MEYKLYFYIKFAGLYRCSMFVVFFSFVLFVVWWFGIYSIAIFIIFCFGNYFYLIYRKVCLFILAILCQMETKLDNFATV